jgi:hypothetical protein
VRACLDISAWKQFVRRRRLGHCLDHTDCNLCRNPEQHKLAGATFARGKDARTFPENKEIKQSKKRKKKQSEKKEGKGDSRNSICQSARLLYPPLAKCDTKFGR